MSGPFRVFVPVLDPVEKFCEPISVSVIKITSSVTRVVQSHRLPPESHISSRSGGLRHSVLAYPRVLPQYPDLGIQ